MPRGTPEGVTRLSQGDKAGRGSFLRLATKTVGAGIGYEVLTQLASAQPAEAATNEQKNRREITSTQSALRQATDLQPTNPKKQQVPEDILPPIPDGVLIIGGIIAVGAGIIAIANRVSERREEARRERERRAEIERERQRTATLHPSPFIRQLDQYIAKKERSEQEAAAQERIRQHQEQIRIQQEQQEAQRREAAERARRNEEAIREQTIREQTMRELEQEVKQEQLDQIAEEIQNRAWKSAKYPGSHVYILPLEDRKVTVTNGKIVNNSRFGKKVGYDYHDIRTESGTTTYGRGEEGVTYYEEEIGWSRDIYWIGNETLSFGIGYFTDRNTILTDAKSYLTDEEVTHGVKGYFIQWESAPLSPDYQREKPTTTTYVYPYKYPLSKNLFQEKLIDMIKICDPAYVIPRKLG